MTSKSNLPKWKLEGCTCWVDAHRYIKMCSKHEAEWAALHKQAMADHKVSSKLFDEGCQKRIEAEMNGGVYLPKPPVVNGDLTSLMRTD